MELAFEHSQQVGSGNCPDTLHFWDNEAQTLYLKSGELYGRSTITPMGEWDNRQFEDEVLISPDSNMEFFKIDSMSEFGAFGSYKSGDKQKMIIYEFQFALDEYLNTGTIKRSIDSPIANFILTLENPESPNPEHPGNVAVSEESSLLSPGAKVIFRFSTGEEEPYDLGEFYVDRSNFRLLNENADVEGRNIIGRALKDQMLDEHFQINYDYIHNIIKNLLQHANLTPWKYLVEDSDMQNWFDFKRNMDVMSALEEIFKATINWRMEELPDGTVVVGGPQYAGFIQRSNYVFHRNKDIFSREITRDDLGAYRRVCIHDSEFTLAVYADVQVYSGWNLQANKTLYVQVPDGTRQSEGEAFAAEVARRLENVGKIESFSGPFRPHIIPGDGAVIVDEKGTKSLGLITEVLHNFGKKGFVTEFTVDSGGRLGRGRLTDYISMITQGKGAGSIGYEEIPPDVPDPPPEDPPPEEE